MRLRFFPNETSRLVSSALVALVLVASGSLLAACNGTPNPTTPSGGALTTSGGSPSSGGQSGATGGSGGNLTSGGAATGGGSGNPSTGGASGTGGAATGAGDVVRQGVRWVGRVAEEGQTTRFAWSGTGFIAKFSGTGLSVTLTNEKGFLFQPVVDGTRGEAFLTDPGEKSYALVSGLSPGEHTVELYRQTEAQEGTSELLSIEVDNGDLVAPPPGPRQVLEVIGDSITCGYGNLGPNESCPFSYETESHYDSYSAIAARALGTDVHTIAISGHGVTRNYDASTFDLLPDVYLRAINGETSPAWNFPLEPRAVVINLGTNDFAQGDPGPNFEDAYWEFLTDLREHHPNAFLLATLGPMLSEEKLDRARTYIQNAVAAFEDDGNEGKVGFLEYTTQVAGERGCDWHPNVIKHESMGEVLAEKLQELDVF
jgi:lysophospholipase L1-like esterase